MGVQGAEYVWFLEMGWFHSSVPFVRKTSLCKLTKGWGFGGMLTYHEGGDRYNPWHHGNLSVTLEASGI